MNVKMSGIVFALGLAALATGCVCPCGDKACACDEAGFVPLFNGNDLDGWSDMKHVYKAEDGMIVFEGGKAA